MIGITAGLASALLSGAFQRTIEPSYLGRTGSMLMLSDDAFMPLAMTGFGALAAVTEPGGGLRRHGSRVRGVGDLVRFPAGPRRAAHLGRDRRGCGRHCAARGLTSRSGHRSWPLGSRLLG